VHGGAVEEIDLLYLHVGGTITPAERGSLSSDVPSSADTASIGQ
jgi:hypothetical protein